MNITGKACRKAGCLLSALVISFVFCISPVCADDTSTTPEPYTDDEFPQWAKDLRRTEIISFGSLPFVTLNSTLAYTMYRYWQHGFSSDYIPNPFAKTSSSANLNTEEQFKILGVSCAISVGLGLTDLVINIIQRNIKESSKKKALSGAVTVRPEDNPLPVEPPPVQSGE